jgi:hypothetical protein
MAVHNNARLAWSVAIAALALWATSVPMTWGQDAAGATRLVDDSVAPTDDDQSEVMDVTGDSTPCAPVPPTPTGVAPAVAAPAPPAPDDTGGTYHLCGPDPAAEQAIAQLIGGHSFSASLSAHGDGCADLTINVQPQMAAGSASSHMAVSLGQQRTLRLDITSQGGVTHVSIGQDQ